MRNIGNILRTGVKPILMVSLLNSKWSRRGKESNYVTKKKNWDIGYDLRIRI